ncbi:choline dehydrogenase protein [Rutstroemia sp. NJR-2017a BBW]|nr:choline dehydrogenase protein [Rutstroemia sp. NJR-2017a BBW]
MNPPMFDIIIAGGGTAGWVLANWLSENGLPHPSYRIRGGSDQRPANQYPITGFTSHGYKCQLGFFNCSSAPADRLLGGSSAINGFAFLPNS